MHKTPLSAASAPPPSAHLSSAVLSQDAGMLYVSGALGMKDGGLVDGNVADRFYQAISNVRALLAEADASLTDVVAITIYLSNLKSDRKEVVEAFARVFSGGIPPTRTIVESSALPSNTDIELTCTAILGKNKQQLGPEIQSIEDCSIAISAGEHMFVSGLAPLSQIRGESGPVGFGEQLREVAQCLKSLLFENSMTVENIVSVMIHLTEYNDDILILNELYLGELAITEGMYKPSRTCVGVQALSYGRIELSCIAIRTHPKQQGKERPSDVLKGAAPRPMYLDIAAPCPSAGLCWVSGAHAPGDTTTGTIEDRTTFSIKWVEHALAAVDLTLHNVVSVSVYITNYQANFAGFNKAYIAGFPDPKPSRTCIGVKNLPQGTDVEITCIAAIPIG